ncbi:MAG TPA: 4'-phosphopantetheinyl transferase superfamily protein [Cytophagales bacterium]|nr:4'-phosphopantetheinyl transferase superfamily protein [Cytophagales bacterium]
MPIIQIQEINNYCKWGIWEINESLDELIHKVDFDIEDKSEYEQIHNETKQLEWLTGKLLIKGLVEHCGAKYSGIYKDSQGKPFLHNLPYHISITHSNKYVGCIINFRSSVGIDLEKIKVKVHNVQTKFLSAPEIETANEDLETLTKFWCAKEALYKLIGKKGVIFSRDINVDLNIESLNGSGFIYYNGIVYTKDIQIKKLEDYIVALAL